MAGTGTRKMGNAKAPAPKKAVRLQTSTNKKAIPGKNTTSAKFERPQPNARRARVRAAMADANKNADTRDRLKAGITAEVKKSKGVIGPKGKARLNSLKNFPKGGNI